MKYDLSKIKMVRNFERGGISEETMQELLRRSLERIEFMKYHLRVYDNYAQTSVVEICRKRGNK